MDAQMITVCLKRFAKMKFKQLMPEIKHMEKRWKNGICNTKTKKNHQKSQIMDGIENMIKIGDIKNEHKKK